MRYASITDRLARLGSEKWAVHMAARRMKAEGRPVIELTIGEPDIAPDPALIDECERALRAGRTRYSNGRGEPLLVEAIAARYRRRRGDVTGRNVLCFPGTQTALFAVTLALAEAGDGVLVGDPLYATYEGVIRASGAHMVPVPLRPEHGFHMRPDDLEHAVTPECRVLLLNTPHNPTGAVLSQHEITALGEVCRRHDLWILCDEVYEELIFDGAFASPFDDPELADRTIVVSSISKSHAAPGFRSGWAVGPVAFADRLLPISETMLFGNQQFIADATTLALTRTFGTAAAMREAYRARAEAVIAALAGAPGIAVHRPEAGMFILIDVRGTGMTGADFAWSLLHEEAVALMPGASFGEQAAGIVRASLTVPEETLVEACGRICALAERAAAGRALSA